MTNCVKGKPDPRYSCKFCYIPVHRADLCECSQQRKQTQFASICLECVVEFDKLYEDTRLGAIHKQLVRNAWFDGRGPSDDA